MKKLSYLVVLIVLICAHNRVSAQLITDAMGVSVTKHFNSNFKSQSPDNQYSENDFSYTTYDAWLPIPVFRIGKASIMGTVNYRLMDFDFDKDMSINPNYLDKINEIRPTIVIKYPVSNRWTAFGVLIPIVASDFKGAFTSDDVVLDGILGISRKFGSKSNLEIGIGPHVMYYFGKFMVTPAVSIDYKSNNGKWVAQAYWPRVNILRNIGTSTQIGLAGSIDWTIHNLKNYKNSEGKEIDYAQYSAIHGGLQINQRLFDSFWLQLQGGLSFANKYELFDSNNKTISNYKADEALYGKLMLTYRFGK